MIKKMDHVGIFVSDIEKAIRFYEDIFGFSVHQRGGNDSKLMAFLTHPGNSDIQLELVQDLTPSNTYSKLGKVNHLAFTVDNMAQTINHLKTKGISLINEPGVNHVTGSTTVFFHGVDGEILQLIEPAN